MLPPTTGWFCTVYGGSVSYGFASAALALPSAVVVVAIVVAADGVACLWEDNIMQTYTHICTVDIHTVCS